MNNALQRTITGLILFFALILFIFYLPALYFSCLLCIVLLSILFFELPALARFNCTRYFLLLPYVLIPFACLVWLNIHNRWLLFLAMLFVAIFDTSAYIAGNLWGQHKIAPQISPGKTWEGLLGGFFMLCIAIWLFAARSATWFEIILLAITITIFAFLGDLFESFLKRKAKLKDAGFLLPGHGGLLDRIDALLPVALWFFIAYPYLSSIFAQ